jgi:hypothetical protein
VPSPAEACLGWRADLFSPPCRVQPMCFWIDLQPIKCMLPQWVNFFYIHLGNMALPPIILLLLIQV